MTATIAIPNYNYGRFLKDAIDSALATKADAVWVFDNCSTDETSEVLASYTDPRLHVEYSPRHMTMQDNWNRVFAIDTDYLLILCADDVLIPEAVDSAIDLLADNPQLGLVCGSRILMDENLRRDVGLRYMPVPAGPIDGRELMQFCIDNEANVIGEPSAVMFRRSLFSGFHDDYIALGDLNAWFTILLQSDAYYLCKPIARIRQHEAQDTKRILREGLADADHDRFFGEWRKFEDNLLSAG